MNKNLLFVLASLMIIVIVAGCTQTQEQSADTGDVGTGTGGVTTSSNQISFKVEMTYMGQTSRMEMKARNLDSDTPDFRMTSPDGSETIILGSEEKGWYTYETSEDSWEWESVSGLYPSWSVIWENYYTNGFLPYYNLTLQAEGDEYSASGETGGVRVYDINWNPELSDSIFADPTS